MMVVVATGGVVVRIVIVWTMLMRGMIVRMRIPGCGHTARKTRTRAGKGDQSRQDRADKRQEDDRLIH